MSSQLGLLLLLIASQLRSPGTDSKSPSSTQVPSHQRRFLPKEDEEFMKIALCNYKIII